MIDERCRAIFHILEKHGVRKDLIWAAGSSKFSVRMILR